jgi:hypothetical protein
LRVSNGECVRKQLELVPSGEAARVLAGGGRRSTAGYREVRELIMRYNCLYFVCVDCSEKYFVRPRGGRCRVCGGRVVDEEPGVRGLVADLDCAELFGKCRSIRVLEAYKMLLAKGRGKIQNLKRFCRENDLDPRHFRVLEEQKIVRASTVGRVKVVTIRRDFVESRTDPLREAKI